MAASAAASGGVTRSRGVEPLLALQPQQQPAPKAERPETEAPVRTPGPPPNEARTYRNALAREPSDLREATTGPDSETQTTVPGAVARLAAAVHRAWVSAEGGFADDARMEASFVRCGGLGRAAFAAVSIITGVLTRRRPDTGGRRTARRGCSAPPCC